MSISYPVSRLLSQPKIFHAISSYLGGLPDAETLRSAFLDMLEFSFDEEDAEDCEFDAEEVLFEVEDDGASCTITFDNGFQLKLEAIEGEESTEITTDSELSAAFAVNRRLITAIEESYPTLKDNISLEHPPTPGNKFLSSDDGEFFAGTFHLRSNPDTKYSFKVVVIDPENDELKATVDPI